METAEQAKRSFKDSREEARRILESPNRAYELLNLIGVRDELLEALRNCVDGLGCQPGYVNTLALTRAQAAIAKAEGR